MSGAEEFIYAGGGLSVDQIQTEIAQFWQALSDPGSSALKAELSAAGLDLTSLADVDTENAITVRDGRSGTDPVTAILIVALAPSVNRIVKDLWATAVLPRIRRRWGEDAIGAEKPGAEKPGEEKRGQG